MMRPSQNSSSSHRRPPGILSAFAARDRDFEKPYPAIILPHGMGVLAAEQTEPRQNPQIPRVHQDRIWGGDPSRTQKALKKTVYCTSATPKTCALSPTTSSHQVSWQALYAAPPAILGTKIRAHLKVRQSRKDWRKHLRCFEEGDIFLQVLGTQNKAWSFSKEKCQVKELAERSLFWELTQDGQVLGRSWVEAESGFNSEVLPNADSVCDSSAGCLKMLLGF